MKLTEKEKLFLENNSNEIAGIMEKIIEDIKNDIFLKDSGDKIVMIEAVKYLLNIKYLFNKFSVDRKGRNNNPDNFI